MTEPTTSRGEDSGALPTVLAHLADYLDARQALRQKTSLALLYTALVATVAATIFTSSHDCQPGKCPFAATFPNPMNAPPSTRSPPQSSPNLPAMAAKD